MSDKREAMILELVEVEFFHIAGPVVELVTAVIDRKFRDMSDDQLQKHYFDTFGYYHNKEIH